MSLHILQRALPGSEWAQEDHVQRLDPVKLTIDSEPTAFLITDLEYKGENGRHMTRQAVLQRSYLIQQNYHSLAVPQNGTKKEQKTFVRVTGGDCSLCAVSAWLRIIRISYLSSFSSLSPFSLRSQSFSFLISLMRFTLH